MLFVKAEDGVYTLDKQAGTSQKDMVYDDLAVLRPGKLLGMIYGSNTQKISLLNLENDGKTKIILQDVAMHERKVVHSLEISPRAIVYSGGKIYMIDENGEGSQIKNLEF